MAKEPAQNKRGRGRPKKLPDSLEKRPRVGVTLPPQELDLFIQWAGQEKLELATHIQQILRKALDAAIKDGSFTPQPTLGKVEKDQELLAGFLRCLAQNWDTDGYSVAEVGRVLGFDGNVELDRMVEALEKAREDHGQQSSSSKKNDVRA